MAIATITWARTPDEGRLLQECVERLVDTGFPLAIADAGTAPAFRAFLERQDRIRLRVPSGRGLVAQVQASVAAAAEFDTPFLLYTEPDKRWFFQQELARFVSEADPAAGAVLANRSAASLATYPPIQQYTEGVINRLCGETVGVAGDYSYGPFLFRRSLVPEILAMQPQLGWGWRHATFVAAHRLGLPIVHIPGDYPCPEEQRAGAPDERGHRIRQLSQNLLGLIG